MKLALLVLVACSSPTKQVDESSAHPIPTPAQPAPAPDAAPPQASGDPWQAKPSDPAPDLALLRADLDILCGSAKATGGKTVMEIGPYAAEHMTTVFKAELFADIRTTTLDEFVERIRKGLARANVQKCDTLDVLIANDPRKH